MSEAKIETEKRLEIANRAAEIHKEDSIGVILTGSVAYAPYEGVTKTSDLDLVIITKDLKGQIKHFVNNKSDIENLKNRFFEGYCFKEVIDEIPVSYHVLTEQSFEIITKCFVADIRVFRPKSKKEEYVLFGFERNEYKYWIKNITLEEFDSGVRTIVPIGFINKDRYYLGIHRDKLLSNPQILHDTNGKVADGIDKTWMNVCENLCDESLRLYGKVDLEKMNIINMLAKRDKMSGTIKTTVIETTRQYVEKCLISRQ